MDETQEMMGNRNKVYTEASLRWRRKPRDRPRIWPSNYLQAEYGSEPQLLKAL